MDRACSTHGEMRNVYKLWSESMKRRSYWEDNITVNLREVGLEGVDWVHLS
jgi:hypothetical protein